jgi:hypothetical protein
MNPVLCRLSWPNEVQGHAATASALVERTRRELSAVVDRDRTRLAVVDRDRTRLAVLGDGSIERLGPIFRTSLEPPLESGSNDSIDRRRLALETLHHLLTHHGRNPCSNARVRVAAGGMPRELSPISVAAIARVLPLRYPFADLVVAYSLGVRL